ncbi:type II toxin-antitoxin system RelE/ParE family toxin [Geomonas anaerohicana]|uniref:Type II toxin-antitoxin system RelE/ParE family toxin n=1 Tax=Geomonas anaerohicana TaxID=2798583 RepID=A0ABS0Y9G6_9BACT|nr:type II toxin-antitoxin system RelE/ParE family toxin [Geomonas anaerohicana]MBJ6748966.1 type II toxin-antitoxin system RelE/ParE family toxin [Geomonas anaerohicana]
MRILATKWFAKFAKKNSLDEALLVNAIGEVEKGNVDADLGCGLIKKRIARAGGGKRAGYRTIIAYRKGSRAIFLYGFSKSAADNVDEEDLRTLKKLAAIYGAFSEDRLSEAIIEGALLEVRNEQTSEE